MVTTTDIKARLEYYHPTRARGGRIIQIPWSERGRWNTAFDDEKKNPERILLKSQASLKE